ncbi:thiamine phosphate synthase [Pararhodonellum marinum]|uniref:thiamine phosphate synthase n=1 Tax=Pararhodonellum marinum TaxID=2755358 RepID=UPI00188FEA55|nr:thiamine phosphate synthase [Pararhodonellum marinum]
MMSNFPYRLYLVTDEALCLGRDFFWVIEEALKGGVDVVQLREKQLSTTEFITKGMKLKALCDRYQVPLIINDNPDVVKATGADGLHIGQSDLAFDQAKKVLGDDFRIGLSLEKLSDLSQAQVENAWYFGVSPIFSTPTKTDTATEWGIKGLIQLRKKTSKMLVAIGGVKVENAADLVVAGADCLAVVSGICSADSPGKAAKSFRIEIEKGLNQRL